MKKAEMAAISIITESKNEKIECEHLDLASLQSIRDFCDRFQKKFSRLDILINNAGIFQCAYFITQKNQGLKIKQKNLN